MTVGERIKYRRIELGLTQQDLAERMGYTSKSAISRVENDHEQNLTTDRLALFAKALETTSYKLMGWDDGDTLLIEYTNKLKRLKESDRLIAYSLIDSLLKRDKT